MHPGAFRDRSARTLTPPSEVLLQFLTEQAVAHAFEVARSSHTTLVLLPPARTRYPVQWGACLSTTI